MKPTTKIDYSAENLGKWFDGASTIPGDSRAVLALVNLDRNPLHNRFRIMLYNEETERWTGAAEERSWCTQLPILWRWIDPVGHIA